MQEHICENISAETTPISGIIPAGETTSAGKAASISGIRPVGETTCIEKTISNSGITPGSETISVREMRRTGKTEDSPVVADSTEQDWEWLCSIPGIYHAHHELLLRCFGSPAAVREASEREYKHLYEKGCRWISRVEQFRKRVSVEEIVNERMEKGIQFISHVHAGYPERLKNIRNRPYGLFYRGSLPDENVRTVAIVGARMCTRSGKAMAELLARETVYAGGQVISGAAYGIDGAAQWETAAQGGKSFAVLGCGVDRCYPAEHRQLLERLRENGGVISELPPGTAPLCSHFPMRNRIISGLSDVVVVVEARKKSGSLITAEFAAEQGRQVMAVPGRPGDELSGGCNELISQGAGLILSAESFAELIFPDYRKKKKEFSENLALAPTEKLVYSSLGLHPKNVWTLQEETSLPLSDLSDSLLSLELRGLIMETDRNYYIKVK